MEILLSQNILQSEKASSNLIFAYSCPKISYKMGTLISLTMMIYVIMYINIKNINVFSYVNKIIL